MGPRLVTHYCQALDDALGRLLDHLTKMPEVEKVILFGSYAAGRRDLFTDLDILVVMDTRDAALGAVVWVVQLLEGEE